MCLYTQCWQGIWGNENWSNLFGIRDQSKYINRMFKVTEIFSLVKIYPTGAADVHKVSGRAWLVII